MSSGDIVAAESYLQHAEHYNRIIMAAQTQTAPNGQFSNEGYNSASGNQRQPDEFNGSYQEQPLPYEEESRPSPKSSPSPRQQRTSAPSAPDSPQPTIPAAPAPREGGRESAEGGRRRRRRHQPNGADHALAEAGEGGGSGRGANGATRNGGMSSDESMV